jgi:oligosaccharide repeat unit polymerase
VCAAAGVPLILRRFPVAWAAVGGFAILLVIFGGGAIFLLKGGDPTLSFGENLAAVVDSLVFYTVGSLPALGRALSSSSDLEWGANSLRFLAALAHAVGFDVRVVSLVQDFTPVPQPINVYTMYHQYIRDFGVIGAIGAQACFGAAHGLLYRRATCRAPRALDVFVYSLALYPLFTQHFVDSYLSLLSTWLQYGLYGWIMFVWAKERRFSRERR